MSKLDARNIISSINRRTHAVALYGTEIVRWLERGIKALYVMRAHGGKRLIDLEGSELNELPSPKIRKLCQLQLGTTEQ